MKDKLTVLNNDLDFHIQKLLSSDKESAFTLCQKASDYFIITGGQPPTMDTVEGIFTDLPPGKDADSKYTFGLFNQNELIGLVDLIEDYPQEGTWWLGLMIMDPLYRGNGAGKKFHDLMLEAILENNSNTDSCRRYEVKSIQLGVLDKNRRVLGFWEKLGYSIVRTVKSDSEEIDIMELTNRNICLAE